MSWPFNAGCGANDLLLMLRMVICLLLLDSIQSLLGVYSGIPEEYFELDMHRVGYVNSCKSTSPLSSAIQSTVLSY